MDGFDNLKQMLQKRKEQFKGKKVVIRSEIEQQKKEEYLKEKEKKDRLDDARLEKRLGELEDFYDFAKLKIKDSEPTSKLFL